MSATTAQSPPASRTAGVISRHAQLAGDERLRSVLDAMPDMVMVVDRERRVLLGNRALADFTAVDDLAAMAGARPGEILACQHAEGGCGATEACAGCGSVAAIQAALAGRHATHECRILRHGRQGMEALELRVSGSPFVWGDETMSLVVAADISDEKRRRLLERIFFHDLLNTAGVISSITELLMQGVLPLEDVKESLHEAAQSLVAEIRSQRDLLAAERNELPVKVGPIHSRLMLEKMIHAYRTLCHERGCTVQLDPGTPEVVLFSDETLLERVMGNLVKNAVEASDRGETVVLGCERRDGEIDFRCRNAAAIPRDVQHRLFLRSFSTKDPGRGVGTYSVKLLTERYLLGRVAFTSSPEDGTTFTVTIPLDIRS